MKPVGKWELRLWKGQRPDYSKGYPGQLFRRAYPNRGSLHRALHPATRAHPTAQLAEITYFIFEGWFWMQKSSESRYRCPAGDGWLLLADGQWTCPHCRSKHADETIRPWLTTTGETR